MLRSLSIETRLFIAVGVSLALHLIILFGPQIRLPEISTPLPPLQARIDIAKPPPPKPEVQPAPARPQRKPVAHKRIQTPPQQPAPATTGETPPGPPVPDTPGSVAADQPLPPPSAPEPVPDQAQAPPENKRRLPGRVEITYALYLGQNRLQVGQTLQTWEAHDDTYRLSSVYETTGLAAFFKPYRLAYASQGRITDQGLMPESFVTRRGKGGEVEDAVQFDWNIQSLNFTAGGEQYRVSLPPGTQDLLSFMYQLALTPIAPGQVRLSITNGRKLESYQLEVGSEETLETPLGNIRTLPIRKIRHPGEEGTEIWLAPDYRFLPVRIRLTDRQGKVSGEQLVTAISTTNE